MRPLGTKIIVKKQEARTQSEGGIILAREQQEDRGEVIAIGEGTLLKDGSYVPVGVEVGDTIAFTGHGVFEVKIDGEKYHVMDIQSVIVVL